MHHALVDVGCIVPPSGWYPIHRYSAMNRFEKQSPRRRPSTKGARRQAPVRSPLVAAPVSIGEAIAPARRIPSISMGPKVTRISHSEMFTGATSGALGFNVQSYACNPGVGAIFPWLAPIAARYESYKFRSLKFRYHTRSATTATGSVCLAFDTDAMDNPPTGLMEAMSYHDSVSDVPWRPIELTVDLAQGDKLPSRYTRTGAIAVTTGFDLKTYDIGTFHLIFDGVTAGTVGLMEVSYVVDLFTPSIQDGIGGLVTVTGGADSTHLLGTTRTLNDKGRFPFEIDAAGTMTFLQRFEGLLDLLIGGTGLAGTVFPNMGGAGYIANVFAPVINAAGTLMHALLKVSANKGTTIAPSITAGTTVTSDLVRISSINIDEVD